MIGLLGTGEPEPEEALLIPGCRSVHGWGMRVSVDCLFLDGRGVVVMHRTLRRGGWLHCRQAVSVLECRLGALPEASPGALVAAELGAD